MSIAENWYLMHLLWNVWVLGEKTQSVGVACIGSYLIFVLDLKENG